MRLNIVIPTFKRYKKLVGKDYFKKARYVLPEKQRDDYRSVLPERRMIVIPDKLDGNIARKRNWILKNIERPILMMDDDVKCIIHSEKGKRPRIKQKIVLSPERAEAFIHSGFHMAVEWGCVLWGINVNTDGRNYQQYKPFSMTQMVLGPFQGHLEHDLMYDEGMGTKDDYDFCLQVLNRYRKILRFNKYAYDCKHGDNRGGIVSGRTMKKEMIYCELIMKKWGENIIKYKMPPKRMGDLLNGIVNVPIAGV